MSYLNKKFDMNIESNDDFYLLDGSLSQPIPPIHHTKKQPTFTYGEIAGYMPKRDEYEAEALPLPEIDPITINVVQSGEGNCDLAKLSAAEYKLSPAFSSDITKYSVEVPYSKSTMEFEAIPLDQEATVKANRKTLKSAGTPTDINLTVTSADKKSKKVYTVTVNRLSKDTNNAIEDDDYTEIKTLDENVKINDNNNNTDELLNEDAAKNNSVELQNSSAPLVVKENSFNFILFFAATTVFAILFIFVIKHKSISSK